MGEMIAAMILGTRAVANAGQFANVLMRSHRALHAYKEVSGLVRIDSGAEVTTVSRDRLAGNVRLQNVSFRYPGSRRALVRNLSVDIPAGQHVALLGKIGSGKTTLARIIGGSIKPEQGDVLLDGISLLTLHPSDRLRNVGVMPQENWLFSGTLSENIRLGFDEYGDDHLRSVCRIAGVEDWAARHPAGYEMVIHERGAGVSGGQRQSIALARALLHNPQLVILDEPTASMDSNAEAEIIERLKFWLGGRTLILVTHKRSLLKLVDRVLVMDEGKIVQDTSVNGLKGFS